MTTKGAIEHITLDPETRTIPVIVASANLKALAGREPELAEKGIYVIAKPFDIGHVGSLIGRALFRDRWSPDQATRSG